MSIVRSSLRNLYSSCQNSYGTLQFDELPEMGLLVKENESMACELTELVVE